MSTYREEDHPRETGSGRWRTKTAQSTGIGLVPPLPDAHYQRIARICRWQASKFNATLTFPREDLQQEMLSELVKIAIRRGQWDISDREVFALTRRIRVRAIAASQIGTTNILSGTVSRHITRSKQVAAAERAAGKPLTAREEAELWGTSRPVKECHSDSLDQISVEDDLDGVSLTREVAEMTDFVADNPAKTTTPVQWSALMGQAGYAVRRGHLTREEARNLLETLGGSGGVAATIAAAKIGKTTPQTVALFELAGVGTDPEARHQALTYISSHPGLESRMVKVIAAGACRESFTGSRARFLTQPRANTKAQAS